MANGENNKPMDLKNAVDKLASGVYFIEKWIVVILFLNMLLLMFIQVFARYVIHSPLAWTEELMRFSFIVASFFGAAVATYEGKHVVINFLTMLMNKLTDNQSKRDRFCHFFDCIVDAVCFLFCGYLSSVLFAYASDLHVKNQLSTALLMPMWWIGYAIAASLALCSFHFLINLLQQLSRKAKKEEIE
jgi:TRAP-type C4-dicarboxylate transport system permease small subunit